MVIVEVPDPGAATGLGLKLTVTPLGWPAADMLSAEYKPPTMATLIVAVPWLPWTTETEAGDAERM
jgi:hypothetical protein